MKFRRALEWALAAHLFVVALVYLSQPKPVAPSKKPMRAITVQLKPKTVSMPKDISKPTPKTASKAASKAPTKKLVSKRSAPKKKALPQKPAAKKTTSAAKKVTSSSKSPTKSPPQPVPVDYQMSLAHALKEQLELPEIGSVELKLTFSKSGSIEKVEVVSSKSEKNERYLMQALRKIELPALPRSMRGKAEPLIIEFASHPTQHPN